MKITCARNITIEGFTQTDFEDYISYAIDEYAEANIKSGHFNKEEAKTKAQKQFDYLLKDGFKSEGHVFWKVCGDGKKIGIFWFHQNPKSLNNVFVYDARIEQQYQNQGIGTHTFSIIREKLKAIGVHKIRLHVFAHNTGAVRLYKRLGFEVAGYNMHYLLD